MCFEKLLWGISEMVNGSFETCPIVFSSPENILVGNGMKDRAFLKNAVGYLRNGECHCVQQPWKLTSRDFWSSRNERKPLSQQKCVLRNCCGVSQKWWMVELSNLCHCVQQPWKHTSRDFWSSRNEQKATFSAKMCFEKLLWGISEMVNGRALKPVPLCSAALKTY